jgi:xanthine dehydrogenase accessory factor
MKPAAMSIDVLEKSHELASQNRPFAIATVVRVKGSSSAKPGEQAVIDSDGKLVTGWIGGGCAESTVRHEALACLKVGRPQIITLDMTDEVLGVGMPCGGVMEVYIEPVLPKPQLLIVGHGLIAETLATLGRLMSFAVTVDDPAASREAFPEADRLIANDYELLYPVISAQTYIVIATQHKQDHRWLEKALESKAPYIALIASRFRAGLVLDYLSESGVPREKLARVSTPAGLDLGATTPEEIALSIMAQIVAMRRGGSGQPFDREAPPAAEKSAGRTITHCEADAASEKRSPP